MDLRQNLQQAVSLHYVYIGRGYIRSGAVLNLENGKTLTIEAKDQSDKNIYVKKVTLNGQTLTRTFLTYAEINGGGKIVFYMDDKSSG